MRLAHVVWPRQLLLLQLLQPLMHCASRIPNRTRSLFKSLLGNLDTLVAGFLRRGRDGDVKLEGVVRVRLGRQG